MLILPPLLYCFSLPLSSPHLSLFPLPISPSFLPLSPSFLSPSLPLSSPSLPLSSLPPPPPLDLDHGLSEPQIRCISKQMFEALAFLHDRGCIHRDIKAGNILLCQNGTIRLGESCCMSCAYTILIVAALATVMVCWIVIVAIGHLLLYSLHLSSLSPLPLLSPLADFGVSAITTKNKQKRDTFIGTPYWYDITSGMPWYSPGLVGTLVRLQ